MAPDMDAVRRWAAVHTATVVASSSRTARHHPTAHPHPAPQAIPTVLASITETRTWHTESDACAVSVYADPDGRLQLAVGEFDGTVRIWDPGTGELLRSLTGHTQGVYSIDWGHDRGGRPLLATGSTDGTVRIWDPRTGELAHRVAMTPDEDTFRDVGAVSWGYSANGRPLLAIGANNGAWIWDPETGDAVCVSTDSNASIYTVSWGTGHHSELLLASAGSDPAIQIYDADAGQPLHAITGHRGAVRTVAWARGMGEPLMFVTTATSGDVEDAAIHLWREGRDGSFTAEAIDLQQGPLVMVSWVPLPDGRMLLVGNSEESLFVLDGSTLEPLYTQPLHSEGCGIHNLGWAVAPDGSLLVCATSNPDRVHVWNITLDPPIPVPAPRRHDHVTSPGQGLVGAGQRGTLLIPPEDLTPQFQADEDLTAAHSVRGAVRADGQILAATTHMDDLVRVWDVSTGALLHTVASQGRGDPLLAWGHLPDGRLLLAVAGGQQPGIQIWDSSTWQLAATPVHQPQTPGQNGVYGIAWIHDQAGRPLLASGGANDGTVCIQEPESGNHVRDLTGHGDYVQPIAEGRLADGRHRLVTGSWRHPARLWDPDTGELLFEFAVPAAAAEANYIWAAAWGRGPDGRPLVAIGTHDGIVRIWDPETGNVRHTLTGHEGEVYSLAWSDQPGWPSVLASCGVDRTLRIWDPGTGTELARLRCARPASGRINAIDMTLTHDGDLLLLVPAGQDEAGQLRIWRIAAGTRTTDGAVSGPRRPFSAYQAGELTGQLLRLGNEGLWPPLGLVADLVTLTSPVTTVPPQADSPAQVNGQATDNTHTGVQHKPDDALPLATPLCDARLAALIDEPGIDRLRSLAAGRPGWGPAARLAFAALLASGLDIPEQYIPPTDTDLASLRGTLADTLSTWSGGGGEPPASPPWRVPVADLRKAAAAITGQTVTLLRILGPVACAADPLLPARLAHRIPHLPTLSPSELHLLAVSSSTQPADGAAVAAGTMTWSPGTAGVARTGPLSQLLPTQLALPRDLLTMRLAENQLLYRQHRAPIPPAPKPVTIILDTTPPTFGPAGNALRLAAHLMTTMLWRYGQYPALVTLTDPAISVELRAPADLVRLWSPATLDDPGACLAMARRTATGLGQPAVCCIHFQTARDEGYFPRLDSRLLTSHQPPERPPAAPTSPWHVHLPPNPTQAQLITVVGRMLTASSGFDGESPGTT